ncbi:MAG: enoyl-CoA hydratase [Burkholderiales bacterium]|nr:enoyl-CoA hydratase [Burkholderiales bacterium]
MTNDILITKANRVLRIQLNRPDKKNALTGAMYDAMREAIAGSNDDPEVRVVFIHGQPDCFTAGNDLAEFQDLARMIRERPAMKFLETISTAVKPIVAAVNGSAVGIGTTLLLHCDLAYAGQGAKFQLPFASLGLCPEGSSSFALARMAGHVQAAELLMLGERFSAERALAMGLVNAVLPDAELLAYAEGKAAQLAAQPPAAIRATKALLRKWTAARVAEVLEIESRLFGERLASPEFAEAARAFFEKRKPDFSRFG